MMILYSISTEPLRLVFRLALVGDSRPDSTGASAPPIRPSLNQILSAKGI